MTSPDELVSELVSSGLTQYQLTLLVKLVSAMSTRQSGGSRVESPDARIERRREWDREYRRKRRAAKEPASTPRPPDKVDGATLLTSFLSSENEEEKRTSEKGSKKEKGSGSARGYRLTVESPLTDELLKVALDAGATEPQAREFWLEFTEYWSGVPGRHGVRLHWRARWRNDVKKKLGWVKNAKAGNVVDAADRLRAKLADFNRPAPGADGGIRDGANPPDVRLLSKG